jgi:hypothetical protein
MHFVSINIFIYYSHAQVNITFKLPLLAHNEFIITPTHSLELMKNLNNSPYINLGKRAHSTLQKCHKICSKRHKKLKKK